MTRKERKELAVSEKQAVEQSDGEPTREGRMFVPQVDIIEDKEGITLRADLPGVKKDSVDIDVREDVLTLTAHVGAPNERWEPVYKEYEVGGFTRRFTLGEKIDREKISASIDNGVLTVVLPKAEAHKPRKIEIR